MKTYSVDLQVRPVSPLALLNIPIPEFISSRCLFGEIPTIDGDSLIRRLRQICSLLETLWLLYFIFSFACFAGAVYFDPSISLVCALVLLPFVLLLVLRFGVLPLFPTWKYAKEYAETLQFLACTLELNSVPQLAYLPSWEAVRIRVLRQRREHDPEVRAAMSDEAPVATVTPFTHAIVQVVEFFDLEPSEVNAQFT